MNRAKLVSVAVAAVMLVTGCADEDAVQAAVKADESTAQASKKPQQPKDRVSHTVKPTTPYRLSYNVIGTPVVGRPVTVQLDVQSVNQASLTQLDFRSRDVSAITLGQSQPATVSLELVDNESPVRQQVTVVPLREGRHYLNVSVSAITPFGQDTTTMAIPIQVGEGGRVLHGNDRITTTESGERVLVNPGN